MNIKGELYIIIANLILATFGILTRELNKELLPMTQVTYRLVLASVILFIIFIFQNKDFLKISFRNLFLLFIAGFFGYGIMVIYIVYALINTTLANATVLLQFTSIFILPLSWIFLKEKIKINAIIAIVLSFFGLLIIFRPNFSNIDTGMIYALVSALFYSFYFIIIRYLININIKTRLFYTTFFAGFFLIPFTYILEGPVNHQLDLKTIFIIILFSILNIIVYFLMNKGLKKVEANIAGILTITQSLFAIFIGYISYGETLTFLEIIGAFFILSSIIVLNIDFDYYLKRFLKKCL
jgi:drug/metabolite transporter (DMT)-like permease